MNTALPKFIGITELRNKAREVFDMLKKEETPVVVMRDSKPEAVIVSYNEYDLLEKEKRRLWNRRLDELAKKTKPYVASFLKRKGYHPKKITGDKLVSILEEEDESSR